MSIVNRHCLMLIAKMGWASTRIWTDQTSSKTQKRGTGSTIRKGQEGLTTWTSLKT